MSLYTGVTGKISIKKGAAAAVDIAHMSNWTVDLNKEMIEAVSFGEDYKEKVPSIKDWNASFDGSADFDSDSGQKMLVDAFEDGSEITCTFLIKEGLYLEGKAYVESLSITDAADGKVDISITVAGSGAVELTAPSGS